MESSLQLASCTLLCDTAFTVQCTIIWMDTYMQANVQKQRIRPHQTQTLIDNHTAVAMCLWLCQTCQAINRTRAGPRGMEVRGESGRMR